MMNFFIAVQHFAEKTFTDSMLPEAKAEDHYSNITHYKTRYFPFLGNLEFRETEQEKKNGRRNW